MPLLRWLLSGLDMDPLCNVRPVVCLHPFWVSARRGLLLLDVQELREGHFPRLRFVSDAADDSVSELQQASVGMVSRALGGLGCLIMFLPAHLGADICWGCLRLPSSLHFGLF